METLEKLLNEAPWRESFVPTDKIVKENNVKLMAEIGVCIGTHLQYLLISNPELVAYAIDPWIAYEGPSDSISQELSEARYKITLNNLGEFGDRVHIIRKTSMDAVGLFQDGFFDLVYIDAIHSYEHAKADIMAWEPKVKQGGIISGHDYTSLFPGCVQAIQESAGNREIIADLSSVWHYYK